MQNDQSVKADAGKIQPSLVPPALITAVAKIRGYGLMKYPNGGAENWKRVNADRYWEATLRHALASWNDWKSLDDESGMLHIAHMATNLAFLLQMLEEENTN